MIRDRLIFLSLSDEAGIQSDRLEVTLDAREPSPTIELGARLEVALGSDDTLVDMGIYTVNELTDSGPPFTLKIVAHGISFASGLNQHRDSSWDTTTLGEIIATVAKRYGLKNKVSEIGLTEIGHIDQSESDMAFLKRLAQNYNAVFKLQDNTITFVEKALGKSASGIKLPEIEVSNFISRTRTSSIRSRNSGVRAYYYDDKSRQRKLVFVGKEGQVFTLRFNQKDEITALKKAKSKLVELSRSNDTLRFLVPFNPSYSAERTVLVKNINPTLDGKWTILKATHTVSDRFLTEVQCSR